MSASSSSTSPPLPSATTRRARVAPLAEPERAATAAPVSTAGRRRLAAAALGGGWRDPWGDLGRLAMPLLTVAALATFAAGQHDPAGAAETRFLALVAGAVLAAIAVAAPAPAREAGWAAALTVGLAWGVGFGPQRGAVTSAFLAIALAYTLARRAIHEPRGLPPGLAVPAALGLQVLLRPDLLLPPLTDARTLVSVLVLPTACGLALGVLALRFGRMPTAIAGAAVAVLAPGWNVATTMTLVALAAGSLLGGGASRFPPVLQRAIAAAAALTLLAPLLWRPASGTLIAAAGLALALADRWRVVPALLAATFATFAGDLSAQPVALLPLAALLPAAPLGALRRGHRGLAAAGAILAASGALATARPPGEMAAAGVALLALALPRRGAGATLQGTWSAILLAGTTLLAGYPWVRDEPLADLLALPNVAAPTTAALLILSALVAVPLLVLAVDRIGPRLRLPRSLPAALVAGVLAILVVAGAEPPQAVPVSYPALVLGGADRSWGGSFGARPVAAVVIDSSLIHGFELAPGTPIAQLNLLDARNRRIAGWVLRAGEHTAEWAAARRDIADRPGFVAPPPWLSQLSPDGSLFAQRFRARFVPRFPLDAAKVSVRLRHDLPEELRLVVYRLEVR